MGVRDDDLSHDPPRPTEHVPWARRGRRERWLGIAMVVIGAVALARLPLASSSSSRSESSSGSSHAGTSLEHVYSLNDGGRFELSVDQGDIVLVPISGREARLSIELRDGLSAPPDGWRFREKRTSPDHVVIEIESEDERRGFFGRSRRRAPVESITIHVPNDVSAELETGIGDVQANGLRSEAKIRSGAGDVEVLDATASISIRTGAGEVTAEVDDAPIDVQTGAGDLLLTVHGGRVELRTGAGTVAVRGTPDSVEARTGAGDVELDLSQLAGSLDVKTGMGGVRLLLPPDAGFDLSAASGLGTVQVNAGGVRKSTEGFGGSLRLSIGGGGENIRLHTGAGDIDVRTTGGYGTPL